MFYPGVVGLTIATFLTLPVPGAFATSRLIETAGVISWQPAKLVPGSPVLFCISPSRQVRTLTAQWFGHEVAFFHDAGGWCGLAAVPVETAAGTYQLSLRENLASGKSVEIQKKIKVLRALYPKIAAKVAKQF